MPFTVNSTGFVTDGSISLVDSLMIAVRIEEECRIDGWMTCDFTSFSTVFQSYQDDERLIMKGCVQWNPVYG